MLSVQEAEALILRVVCPLDPHVDGETVALESALGRILAQPVTGNLDVPQWDNSAMDGYAVRYADVASCGSEQPIALEVIEDIPAGYQPQRQVQAGQAARIFTGAMLPAGADTVVMQEVTQQQGDRVTILSAPAQPQAFVRRQAAFYRAGDPLLAAGVSVMAPEVAVLATAQCTQVPVYRRPQVAIFSTGNELVAPGQPLQPGQIVDSNQYALAALVQQAGAVPMCLGVVPDQPEVLRQAIAHALTVADLVISSGGVSVGDYDYIDGILEELGATIHIRSVAVRPGKPLTVATFTGASSQTPSRPTPYFGLPGNPVSALVSFWRFVLPALRKLSGLAAGWEPLVVRGRSQHPLHSDGKRETYLWGRATLVEGNYTFALAGGSHSSGNLINLAQSNCLAVLPVGQMAIAPGEAVDLLLLSASL